MQGHAGTVPMSIRRDPLAAAAEAIHKIEQRCQQLKPYAHSMGLQELRPNAHSIGLQELKPNAHSMGLQDRDAEEKSVHVGEDCALVCTVGSISVWPGASNVIPGSANFSVDIR